MESANLSEIDIELMTQPGSGITSLLDGIENARQSIHIVIFRFDRREVELALKRAARRGVFVHALVSHTSAGQGGEITLRKLEMRLLADGITVTRTASDLLRYHSKIMVVDSTRLYLLAFNFTYLDIDRSRSFGIVTHNEAWVREAEKLFQCDTTRQEYTSECESFIVSPANSRQRLLALLGDAQRQLLIYDDRLSDPAAMSLLAAKVRSGVDVRVIGSVGRRATGVSSGRLKIRLHAQVIIQDGERLFLGSQSLRSLELDARREAGIVTCDPEIIRRISEVFESDWRTIQGAQPVAPGSGALPGVDAAELAKFIDMPPTQLPPVFSAELVRAAIKEAIKDAIMETVLPSNTDMPLKAAVKQAAREALHELGQ